jgi:hypothetical protein
MNTLNETTTTYITELKAQGYTDDLIQAALKAVLEAKAKEEAKKAKAAKPKAEPSEEDKRKAALKKLTADLAKLEGVKVATKDYSATTVKRTNGKGELQNADIILHATENQYTAITIHAPRTKGSRTDLKWGVFTIDKGTDSFIYEGKAYKSLYTAHRAFYPDHTFSNKATVKSAYFLKAGETPGKLPDRQLSESFIHYTVKATPKATTPKSATPAASIKGDSESVATAPEDSESEGEAEEAAPATVAVEEELVFNDEGEEVAPATAAVALPVATGVIRKGKPTTVRKAKK